jgi:hypothetical protein
MATARRSYPKRKPYKRAKTNDRGLGWKDHQLPRARHMKALEARPGQPCPHCRAPMFATVTEAARAGLPRKLWHVDLDDYPGRVLGGPQIRRLMHRHCNRSRGARLGNRLRAMTRPTGYTRW